MTGVLRIEPLEDRRLLTIAVSLTPDNEVTFLGDAADDTLILQVLPDGVLQYTTFQGGSLTASTDLDPTVAGSQSLQASQISKLGVDAGQGNDRVTIASQLELGSAGLSISAETILVESAVIETGGPQAFGGTMVLTRDTTLTTNGTDFNARDARITSDAAGPYQLTIVTQQVSGPAGDVILSQVGDADGPGPDNTGVGQLTIQASSDTRGNLIFDRASPGEVSIELTDADFQFEGGNVQLRATTTIDTQQTDGRDAGDVRLGPGHVSADAAGRTLTVDSTADGVANGGDVTLGPVGNGDNGAFLDSLRIDARALGAGAEGNIHLDHDILVDGGLVRLAGPVTVDVAPDTTMRIGTEQDGTGPAGDVDLQLARIAASSEDVDLAVDASTSDPAAAAGAVRLGSLQPLGPQHAVRNLNVDAEGAAAGDVRLPVPIQTAGDILIQHSATVVIAADVTAQGNLVIENAQTVELAADVALTASGGDIVVATGVGQIDLTGTSGTNAVSASGSVMLAPIADSGSPEQLAVEAGADVTLATVTLDAAPNPLLSIKVDQGLQAGVLLADALESGTVTVDSNHDVTLTGRITATAGPVTVTVSDNGTSGNLVVAGGAAVTSTSSSVLLHAGDDVTLQAASVVTAATTLEIKGDNDPGNVVQDPQGTTIEVVGVVRAVEVELQGDSDDDHLLLAPDVAGPEPSSATFTVIGAAGNDTLDVRNTAGLTTLHGNEGDDQFNLSSDAPDMSAGTVNGIAHDVTVEGDGGIDTLHVSDAGDATGDDATLSPTQITGLGNAGTISYAVEQLTIDLGAGDDTLLVTGTIGGTTTINSNGGNDTLNVQATDGATTIDGGEGDDRFNVSSDAPAMNAGTVDGIAGDLTLNGGGGIDSLGVSDAGDNTGDDATLSPTQVIGLGNAGAITYAVEILNLDLGVGDDTLRLTGTHDGATVISTGAGGDTLSIQATGGPTTIKAGAGDDRFNVSSDAPAMTAGTVDGIAGDLTLNGDDGIDSLHVSDRGGTTDDAATLSPTQVTGLGNAGAITYAVDALTLDLGTGSDTLRVSGTHEGTTAISAEGGNDTLNIQATGGLLTVHGDDGDDRFNVSSAAPDMSSGTVDGITHDLTVVGDDGADTLHVSDSGDTTGDAATLSPTQVTGLGNAGAITYDVDQLTVDLGAGDDTLQVSDTHGGTTTVHANAGNDTLNVQATSGVTRIDAGDGNDQLNVSSAAPDMTSGTVDGIAGDLTVNGDGGNDSLHISDRGGTTGDDATLSPTQLTGLGNAGAIIYAVDALTLDLGTGNDTLRVSGTHEGTTAISADGGNDTLNIQATGGVLTVHGDDGDDQFNVSSNAPDMTTGTVDGIVGDLTVNGDDGNDSLHVSDRSGATDDEATLSPTQLTGLGNAGAITYAVDALTLDLGTGNDTLRVSGTHEGTTAISADGGDDTLNIQATGGLLTVHGDDGDDQFNVSSNAPDMSSGTVDGIAHDLTVVGDDGIDALHISDAGDATGDAATLGPTQITGLGNAGTITYAVDELTVDLGAGDDTLQVSDTHGGTTTVHANAGNDTLNVQATSGVTRIDAGDGNDQLNVSSAAPDMIAGTVDGIAADLTLNGDDGDDSLHVSDFGDATGDAATLSPTQITGLGNAGAITYAVNALTLDLGTGDDTLLVSGTHAGATTVHANVGNDTLNIQATGGATRIDAGDGDDRLNVSSAAPDMTSGTVDGIVGDLTVNGDDGSDLLHVSDFGDATGDDGTLSPTQITGLGNTGVITYAINTLTLDLGAGSDTLLVSGTHAGATALNANGGNDTLSTQATRGLTMIDGGAGNDTFDIGDGNLDHIQGAMTVVGGDHGPDPTRDVASGGQVQTLGLPVGPGGYATSSTFAPGEPVAVAAGDRINLLDHQATTSSTYRMRPLAVGPPMVFQVTVESSPNEPGTPARDFDKVDYSTIETFDLQATGQNDIIEIQWSQAGQQPDVIRIDGGGGSDNFVDVLGTPADDQVTVDDASSDVAVRAPLELENVGRIRVRGAAGDDVIHNKSAVPALFEGETGDDILVTDLAMEDVLAGGGGRDALFGEAADTFYLPDAEVDPTGELVQLRVDGDLVIANGLGRRVSSLGQDKIGGAGCGENDLFVNGGEIGVMCWLKAVFLGSTVQVLDGPEGAQVRVDQLIAPPAPHATAPAAENAAAGVIEQLPPEIPIGGESQQPAAPTAGDANRDGQFDQFDIIQVLTASKYATGQAAAWEQGDWNGDGFFDQLDLVFALQESEYQLA